MITRLLVKRDDSKTYGTTRMQNWLFVLGVALIGIAIGLLGGFLINL